MVAYNADAAVRKRLFFVVVDLRIVLSYIVSTFLFLYMVFAPAFTLFSLYDLMWFGLV